MAPVYALLMIVGIALVHKGETARRALCHLGRYSVYMWMIHAWLCKYLFHDAFFSLRYPLAVWAALVVASYVLSRAVHPVVNALMAAGKG